LNYKYLTKKDLVKIHNNLIRKYGGFSGVLFDANLDFCVEAPQRVVFGSELYNTLHAKAACFIYGINKLHPFLDGNKRTGLTATDVFLRLNGYELTVSYDEGVKVSLEIASCSMENPQITAWIKNRIRKLR